MESPKAFRHVPRQDSEPHADPVETNDNAAMPKVESGPSPILVETNAELRRIVNDLGIIENPADRVLVFQRMFRGTEVVTDNPSLIPFFDRISAIEDTYGRDAVREIAILYGADRIKDTGA